MQIAVCDDSALDRKIITSLLSLYFSEKAISYEIFQYENGTDLIYDVEESRWFDVIFLDIYLNGQLGIDVARRLRTLHYDGEIVFLSASSEFAVDSYDVEALSYILKPHSIEKLHHTMDRIIQKVEVNTYRVKQRSKMIRIPFHEILYVESSNSKCILHRRSGDSYVIYKRLNEIERELSDPRFLRCHQSYLVNMDCIEQADRQFRLSNGETVMIRQRNLKAIRQHYMDYLASKEIPASAP